MPTQHLTCKGLVLRETAFGDADKLFDLLTENGILTVRARSVRKPGSKYAAVTQLFVYGEYCLRQSGKKYYLDSAVSLEQYYGIRDDLESLALASYFSELIQKTATEQPQPQLLRLFCYALHYLSEHSRPILQVKAVFELRLITELGLMPNLVFCTQCMNYLPEHPVLRIEAADLICRECLGNQRTQKDIPVSQSILHAVRHVVFSDYDRLFLFRLSENRLPAFANYTEQYLLYRLEMPFRTLKFFHELTGQ